MVGFFGRAYGIYEVYHTKRSFQEETRHSRWLIKAPHSVFLCSLLGFFNR